MRGRFRPKVDGFVPQTRSVNFRKVGQAPLPAHFLLPVHPAERRPDVQHLPGTASELLLYRNVQWFQGGLGGLGHLPGTSSSSLLLSSLELSDTKVYEP